MNHEADPKAEYTRRLKSRRQDTERHERRHRLFGNLKLLTVAAALLIVWLRPGWWWLAAPGAAFVALQIIHERVLRALRRSKRAEAFYQRGIDRIEDRWIGTGATGVRFDSEAHPYAGDLDLFGDGSLFQLLSSARTRAGEDFLAHWLMQASPVEEVRARQQAVIELRSKIDLREELALLGEDAGAGVHAAELAAWAVQPPVLQAHWVRGAGAALVALLAICLTGWGWFSWPLTPALLVIVAEALLGLTFRIRVLQVASGVEEPSHDLDLLSQVLVRLEQEQFVSPRLAELRAALDTAGVPASRQIARLDRLVELLDSRDHVLMRAIGPLVMWTTQLTLAIETWRARHGVSVPRWLDAVGEIEALCSLAAYSFEHPGDPFPELQADGPCYHGEALAHPLLPAARAIRNDVQLDNGRALLLVSGSNMSGKSTLLRTVGVNAVLALAGAPVRARSLRLSVFAVGASMRIHDSLQAGTSRFYAEVLRIRQLVGISENGLLLFLLDELLHGTNSHDRRIGAGAVLRSLLERGAIGFATTHDLALADIAGELAPRAANVHFEDQIRDGQITFDYRMRPGIVAKSNALELMRSVGLDV